MKVVTLGTVSSDAELASVTAAAKRHLVIEAMECLVSIAAIEKHGFSREQKRWRTVAEDRTVKIYVGNAAPAFGVTTVWAAITLGADAKTVTLLKIVDSYGGGDDSGLLADACDRKQRGQSHD